MKLRFAPSPHRLPPRRGCEDRTLQLAPRPEESDSSLVLRIEDTDRERSTDEAIEQLIDGLEWLELGWDEGPSGRRSAESCHERRLGELLDSGKAYWDVATGEDVKRIKGGVVAPAAARPSRGNAWCGGAVTGAGRGETVVEDVIRGQSAFENRLLDDFVIARSDRSPLYNFAVQRRLGDGHNPRCAGRTTFSNTPRQLIVLKALDAPAPMYAHLPLLHGTDGKPPRNGTAPFPCRSSVRLATCPRRCGTTWRCWDGGTMRRQLLQHRAVQKFQLERVSRSPAVFDEQKLRWMNGQYIRNLSLADLTERLRAYQEERGPPGAADPRLEAAAAAVQEKISTLSEFTESVGFAFEPIEMDERSWRKVMEKGRRRRRPRTCPRCSCACRPIQRGWCRRRAAASGGTAGCKTSGPSFSRFVLPSPARRCRRCLRERQLLGKEESLARITQCANAPRYSVDLVATIQSNDRLCMNAVCALTRDVRRR